MLNLRIPPSGPFVPGLLTVGTDALLVRADQHDFPHNNTVLDGTQLPSTDLDSITPFVIPPDADVSKLWWRYQVELRSSSVSGEAANFPVSYAIQLLTALPGTWTTIFTGNLYPIQNLPTNEGPLIWELETCITRFWKADINATVAAAWVPGAQVGVRLLLTATDPGQQFLFANHESRAETFELLGTIPVLS